MEKNNNNAYWILTLLGGIVGILGKSKSLKVLGYGTASIAGGIFVKKLYDEEKKKVEVDCQEVESSFRESGIDPNKISTVDLLQKETEDEETVELDSVFGKTLLGEAYKNSIFPDEMLEYRSENHLHTLHVMQNVEKNRIIISIPLPKKTKGSLSPQDIREYYQTFFENFIEENKLDMKPYLNQIGVHVILGAENPPFTYYEEIVRRDDESFREYLDRINMIRDEFEKGDVKISSDKLGEGEKTLRFDQYLNLEFPVFPAHSNKKGLDLLSAMKLLKMLSEPASIRCASLGRNVQFDLSQITFHPTDDYGTILTMKGGQIKVEEL